VKHALLLLAALHCTAEPVRVAILSRAAQLLPEALERFERQHGAGLLEVRIGDGSGTEGFGEPDVAVFYFGGQDVFRRHAGWVRAMEKRGGRLLASPAENAERLTGARVDRKASEEMAAYWAAGGVENLTGMLSWLYRYGGGGKDISVPPVQAQPATGLVHPRSGTPFHSLEEYLRWERTNGGAPANAPLAGVLVYQTSVKNRDMAVYEALIQELERQGMRAVGVYGWPVHTLEPLLRQGEGTPFDGTGY